MANDHRSAARLAVARPYHLTISSNGSVLQQCEMAASSLGEVWSELQALAYSLPAHLQKATLLVTEGDHDIVIRTGLRSLRASSSKGTTSISDQIEACHLALTIINSLKQDRSRLLPIADRILLIVDAAASHGVDRASLYGQFERRDRPAAGRAVRQMVRDGTLIERGERLRLHTNDA